MGRDFKFEIWNFRFQIIPVPSPPLAGAVDGWRADFPAVVFEKPWRAVFDPVPCEPAH